MISVLTLSALSGLVGATDAPERLITQHGVELVADEDVFVLFAALNALGYSEETRRKGPPLRAPVFHSIREEVRDALRKVDKKGATAGIKKMFDDHPAEIEHYLELVLANGGKLSKEAAKLTSAGQTLGAFRETAELTELFDQLAEEQRGVGVQLKAKVEKDFEDAAKLMGGKGIRAPLGLRVVPNPLDGHDVVRRLWVGTTQYLVVGPGLESAQREILEASLRPLITGYVKAHLSKAPKFRKDWEGLPARISKRFGSPEAYLAESITRAIAHRTYRKKVDREADEEFIDGQAKDGLRWTRVALKLVDDAGGAPLDEALGRLLPKAAP